MVKKMMMGAAGTMAAAMLSGCVIANGNSYYPITVEQRDPVQVVDNTVKPSKVGIAQKQSIILVGIGDGSIDAAARNAGITKIHHIDHEITNVLGIVVIDKTLVYGE
jgi:hypothetical protein